MEEINPVHTRLLSLIDITNKLKKLAKLRDTENAHGLADEYLKLAILELAADLGVEKQARSLTQAFDNLPKWYA